MRSTRFMKGNQAAKRRKRRRGGRPTRKEAEIKKLAGDLVRNRLEESLGSIADCYVSQATGLRVGNFKCRLDSATTRHAVDRFLSQAPRRVILDAQETVESFFEQVMKEGEKEEPGKSDGQKEKS